MNTSEESWFTLEYRDSPSERHISIRGSQKLDRVRNVTISQVIDNRTACVRRNLDGLFSKLDIWNVRKEHDYVLLRDRMLIGKVANNIELRGWVDAIATL